MFDLNDRTALVTGATGGIGAAIARMMHAKGAVVAISGRRGDLLDSLAGQLAGRVHVLPCDIANREDVEGLVPAAEKAMGHVDILVNNAGITKDGMFHKMTPEQWYDVINTNLNSLFNMCRPVIEGMRERGFGRIINISSINGQKGQMGQANYSASKAGDIGFTKALAQENASKGVTVNAICPGYIATEMVLAVPKDVLEKSIIPQIPVRRLGQPEDIARCVLFLASDDAGFITGSTLSANGGQYLA
jgi:acetoacetyl-CoA reductase